jgi:threonine synthase
VVDVAFQQCIRSECGATFDAGEILFACKTCGALLDVRYNWERTFVPRNLQWFNARRGSCGCAREEQLNSSGVWRFRELIPIAPEDELVTHSEGRTLFQRADELARVVGHGTGKLFLQYEGFNPSGSFKDNGMAAGFTVARRLGRRRVACASTGNTSASLAMYAGVTRTKTGEGMQAVVFVGGGRIALGKLAQALDFGAMTLEIDGDFDTCMKLVQESADRLGLYLLNSVNPYRLEGQKAIIYRVLDSLDWEVPDWIIVPGGNLGNGSAFGKAFAELMELGLIARMPRLAIINAAGANTLTELVNHSGLRYANGRMDDACVAEYYRRMSEKNRVAKTVATAIEIGRPVNLAKALRSLDAMNGEVRQVEDDAILDGKALVGRYGFGCEPAGGASIAGLRLLLQEKTITPDMRVVCILTGHALKDPNATVDYHARTLESGSPRRLANRPVSSSADIDEIARILGA